MGVFVIKQGQVLSVKDPHKAGRIKVLLPQDGIEPREECNAFPLLPKYIQSPINEGDAVFVISSEVGNIESQRYYIGPIISQPQGYGSDKHLYGRGPATAALDGTDANLQETIDNFEDTKGAFPNISGDTALVGKVSEDILLRDREIDIRCGIRGPATNIPELNGNVVFNTVNPSYIQLKFAKNGTSYVNIVGDSVNIMSHDGITRTDFGGSITDQDHLIKEEYLESLRMKLHPVPYGDVLVEYLERIRTAFNEHQHAWLNMPPDGVAQGQMNSMNFGNIMSDTLSIT